MSSRTVSVALQAKIDGYTGPLKVAAKETEKLGAAARKAGDEIDGAGKKSEQSFKPGKLRPVAAEWEKLQDTAVNNSQAWGTVSNTLLTAGAAAGTAVALVAREYASFDAAMSGVASTGDDARQNIDALREAAKRAGADTAFSAVEAANGVEELARAGVSASDILGGGLKGSLDLAAAGQIGVAESAGIASIAMTQFKLKGSQIPHVADLLAAGAGKAMGSVDDLGMALKQGGLVASQFGLSIEETVGGLSAFAASGLLGSDAGTSLKTMLLKLASPSKEAAKLMQELGINAHDASGQFVGLESLAGQLQTAFAGQSDATRDAAMATIFGTDAIRAANILYSEGQEGIAGWTAAVDDAGYAAETAATLQNNLKGDLEKLGGAFSTLAIEAGAAANGPLRAVVQGLTALVDIAGQSPVAAQAVLGVTAALAGLALAAGGIMKGVSAVAEFRTSLATLTEAYPGLAKVEGVIGKIGKAAGIAAGAFVGWQLAVAAVDALAAKGPELETTAAALERIRQGTEGLDSLNSTFQSLSGGELVGGVDSLASAIQLMADASNNVNGSKIAYAMESFVTMGNGQLDKLAAQFKQVDQALSDLSMSDATAIFAQLRDQAFAAGMSMQDLTALFPSYAAQVQALAAANGLGELSADDLAMAMAGMYGPLAAAQQGMADTTTAAAAQAGAYDEAAAAAEAQAKAAEEAAQAQRDALSAYEAAADAIRQVNDAHREGASLMMNEQAAGDRYIEMMQKATEQIKENGTSLDENTAKGRANRAYIRDAATSARDYTDAMLANGQSVDVVNAKMVAQRAQFIKMIGQFGITGAAAEAYADDLGLIPNYVATLIATPGAKLSKKEADDLNRSLEGLPDEVRARIVAIANTRGAEEAKRAIASVHGKTVTVRVRTVGVGSVVSAGGYTGYTGRYPGKATGGRIIGPGTGTSDDVPILASNGEYMIRTWAAQKIGYHRMEYINRTGELPRFADGGRIGGEASWANPSYMRAPTQTTRTYNIGSLQLPDWVRTFDDVVAFADSWDLETAQA